MRSPPGRPSMPPTSIRPGRPTRPTRLGQWQVVAKIAGGGMATIYLARPHDGTEPVVAVKVLKDEHAHDERVARLFIDEAKLLSAMVHPNVVRTLEAGVDEAAGCRFIAMELMLGATLASVHDTAVSRGHVLPSDVVAWIGGRVAEALHYAHELRDAGGVPLEIIHRDVNPKNVYVTIDGGVKLFDFGMARSQGGAAVSSPGIVAGTLPYLSPEQIMQRPLDRRADLFALGTSLWELLTGHRLFRRDDDAETLRAVQFGKISDPRSVVATVPERLSKIVMKLLERNREHRYPTGEAVARELDAFLASEGRPTPPQTTLATAFESLFPGERKRQLGWLKPPVGTSIPPTSLRPPPTR